MMKIKTTLTVLLAAFLLQACVGYGSKYTTIDIKRENSDLKDINAQKQQSFMKYKTAFLGIPVRYNAAQRQLLARKVNFHSESPVELTTVLETLASQAHCSYRLNTQLPASPGDNGDGNNGNGGLLDSQLVNYNGTVEGLIQYLSALYDVTIDVTQNNIIQADVYHTYAINLDFFGKDSNYEASLDLSSNQATSSGGMKGKSETKFTSTFWDDVEKMVQHYISSGVYNIFQDVGVLTFSARPSEYARLEKMLKDFREINTKQFVISYKIYILDKTKARSLSMDLGGTFGKLGTSFSFNGGGNIAGTALNVKRTFSDALTVAAKLDALYNLTGSRVLQSGTLVTRNNVPAPLNLTKSQNYVSGVITTNFNQTGIQDSEVKTDTIITGTSVIITPRLLSDGRVELTSAFTKKNLDGLDNFPSGGGTNVVQLPKISTTELFNTVDVSAGSLVIIGQYEQEENTDGRGIHILGGNLNLNDSMNTVVMVVGVDYYNKPFEEK